MRIRSLFSRRQLADELDEELRYQFERDVEESIARGASESEARRTARIAWNGAETRKDECRDMRGWNLLDHTLRDLRYAVRQLRKTPSFTATALLALTLGLGGAIAIFAFVDAALVRPMPYTNPSRLLDIAEKSSNLPRTNLSYLDYIDWKQSDNGLQAMSGYTGGGFLLTGPNGAEPVPSGRVSADFFRTLGVIPVLGRDFLPNEDTPAAARVAVLSHASWQKRFAADPNVIGKVVVLSDTPYIIAGVLPREFHFAPLGRPEFWVTNTGDSSCEKRRSCHNMYAVGRMKDGVQPASVLASLTTLAARLEQQYPLSNRFQSAAVQPLSQLAVATIRPILLVLLSGAVLLLLIAFLNVAALLLVRAENRRREVAIRGALGASSARLLSQFITEGLLLVSLGTALGLIFASGAIRFLHALLPARMSAAMPYLDHLSLTPNCLLAALALAVLAAALFAVIPSLYVQDSALGVGLAESSRGSAGLAWRRLGSRLVIAEFAAAMVLLTGAGLIGKSLYQLLRVDLAFRPERLVAMSVSPAGSARRTPEQAIALSREAAALVARIPGVESVGLASQMPVTFNGNTNWVRFEGLPYNGEHNEVNARTVSPAYFETIGAKLIRGRFFADSDDKSRTGVAVVNQTLVRKYFTNGEDPVGRRIGDLTLSPNSLRTIVGVVDDIREGALNAPIAPAVYECSLQDDLGGIAVFARAAPGITPDSLLAPVRAALRERFPDAGISNETTLEAWIQQTSASAMHRSAAWLVSGFAVVALVLGIVGLYGVVAYSVGQRTREIGIRLALGAVPGTVKALILRESGRLVAVAAVLGIAGSITAATFLQKFFYGVAVWDIPALAAVTLVLGLAAALATYLPARRAASVNPMDVLRTD